MGLIAPARHAQRVAGLMAFAAALLGWLALHTDVIFADGLRYIRHAQQIDRGDLAGGLFRAIDHPLYPLSIEGAHKVIGGTGPLSWQYAAQLAAIAAAVLLVVPLYLIALELFDERSTWLGVALSIGVPVTSHVFADGLSESTFLLGWCWGFWGALRFLRRGAFGWLVPAVLGALMAYLTRPEGLLLPAALIGTLVLMPFLRSTRLNWPRWGAAVGLLVVLPGLIVAPYAWKKGGLGSKPAIARVLGTMPQAPPDAVERGRVADPNQSTLKTYATAAKETLSAVREAVTLPLLVLAPVGVFLSWRARHLEPRARLFVGLAVAGTLFALVRLHATSGYCTPRHTLTVSLLLFPAAAAGFVGLMERVRVPGRWVGAGDERLMLGPLVWIAVLLAFGTYISTGTLGHLNPQFQGYRGAAAYVAEHVPPGEKVVDYSGWALFYGERPGYTFRQIADLPADPGVRWVVARESHLKGPWGYSRVLRDLTRGLEPVKAFPDKEGPGVARILVFDRAPIVAAGFVTTRQ
jgi:hypothetical protein